MSIRTDAAFYVEHAEGIAQDLDLSELTNEHTLKLKVEEVTDYVSHELGFTEITSAAERKVIDAACDAFYRVVENRRASP